MESSMTLMEKDTKPVNWIAEALEGLGLAMLTTDSKGLIDRANAAACAMLGLAEPSFLGKPIDEVLEFRDGQGARAPFPLRALMEEGLRFSAKDGWRLILGHQGVEVNVSAAPLRYHSGCASGAVFSFCPMEPVKISERSHSAQKLSTAVDLNTAPQVMPAHPSLYVRNNGRYIRVLVDELLWVEAMENYVHMQTTKERLTVHCTLKSIAEALGQKGCKRIHRSFLVKLDAIETIEENHVTVAGTALPIGKSYRAELLDAITLL